MSEKTNVPKVHVAPAPEDLAKLQADYNAAEAELEAASQARVKAEQKLGTAAKALNEAVARQKAARKA